MRDASSSAHARVGDPRAPSASASASRPRSCLAWPHGAAIFEGRFGALTARGALRRKLAEATRVETDLRTSEERLRTLVDLATDAIFIKDRGGRYVLMNPAGARLLGRETAEE